jgi:dynein heavy chain 1
MNKQGGAPFGPAGTGKTETVKSLSAMLGRPCIVFNCDASFDVTSMGRIFSGLCQTGAWGCFDEFNRLEERVLSAVSQQIVAIQMALRASNADHVLELNGRFVKIDPNVAIFVTMNLGYAGRAELPDNLKQLFRGVAMTKPNSAAIAEITLFTKVRLLFVFIPLMFALFEVLYRVLSVQNLLQEKLCMYLNLAVVNFHLKSITISV